MGSANFEYHHTSSICHLLPTDATKLMFLSLFFHALTTGSLSSLALFSTSLKNNTNGSKRHCSPWPKTPWSQTDPISPCLILSLACRLIHGYNTNSSLYTGATAWPLITTWLNSLKCMNQPISCTQLLMHYSLSSLHKCFRGLRVVFFFLLHHLSGTLFPMKPGH